MSRDPEQATYENKIKKKQKLKEIKMRTEIKLNFFILFVDKIFSHAMSQLEKKLIKKSINNSSSPE